MINELTSLVPIRKKRVLTKTTYEQLGVDVPSEGSYGVGMPVGRSRVGDGIRLVGIEFVDRSRWCGRYFSR